MKKLNPFDKRSIFRDPVNTFTPLSKMDNDHDKNGDLRYTCVIKRSNDVFKIIFLYLRSKKVMMFQLLSKRFYKKIVPHRLKDAYVNTLT